MNTHMNTPSVLMASILTLATLFQSEISFSKPLIPAVSLEEATTLFSKLAARDDISFKVPESFCEMRALKMNKLLEEWGYLSQKIVMGNNDGQKFELDLPYAFNHHVSWLYHVAPTIRVKIAKIESVYILDPSLFVAPVPLEVFLAKLDPKNRCPMYTAENVKKELAPLDEFTTTVGSGPCYSFIAERYFFSPNWEDLSIISQLKYKKWNKDLLTLTEENLSECMNVQAERLKFLEAHQMFPQSLMCFE